MNLIGLPGRNPETAAWLADLGGRLELGQRSTHLARYRHWNDSGEPDVGYEAGNLSISPNDLVVGKSLGTLILLTCWQSGVRPARAVLIGYPLIHASAASTAALKDLAETIPTLFIQQTGDFTGPFADLEAQFADGAKATLVEVAGSDHVYADTRALARIISDWWWQGSADG